MLLRNNPEQTLAPEPALFPSSQGKQIPLPSMGLNFPWGQSWQVPAPPAPPLNRPGAQAKQAELSLGLPPMPE